MNSFEGFILQGKGARFLSLYMEANSSKLRVGYQQERPQHISLQAKSSNSSNNKLNYSLVAHKKSSSVVTTSNRPIVTSFLDSSTLHKLNSLRPLSLIALFMHLAYLKSIGKTYVMIFQTVL